MQAQVREAVYWPSIHADIVEYVCQCTIWTKHKASPLAQPMLPRDIPNGPWQEIKANYLTHKGREYLLVCNLFNKYPFIYKVSTKSAQSLCASLHEFISQYGTPSLLFTDNGPLSASDKLAQFLQCHHIDCIPSSPHFQRSNGFIEHQVHTQHLQRLWQDLRRPTAGSAFYINRAQHAFPQGNPTQQDLTAHPGGPSTPVDMESVRNYLLSRKQYQNTAFDRAHGTCELQQLDPGKKCFSDPQAMMITSPGLYSTGLLCHAARSLRPKANITIESGKT